MGQMENPFMPLFYSALKDVRLFSYQIKSFIYDL